MKYLNPSRKTKSINSVTATPLLPNHKFKRNEEPSSLADVWRRGWDLEVKLSFLAVSGL